MGAAAGVHREPAEHRPPAGPSRPDEDAQWRLRLADRLDPGSRGFLEALYVLGGRQAPATVARVAELPEPSRVLGLLRALGLVVVTVGGPGEPQCSSRVALAPELDGPVLGVGLRPTRWRALNLAAAAVLPARRALVHKALAADRPDSELAAALEDAALDGRAPDEEIDVPTRRLLEWAADLSPDRAGRERRLLLAAMHDVYGGQTGAGPLWDQVEALPPSPVRFCALAGRAVHEHRPDAASELLRAARRASGAAALTETVEAAMACSQARGAATVEAATKALDAGDESGACPGDEARGRQDFRDAVRVRAARRLLTAGRAYVDGPREALRYLDELGELPDVHCRDGSRRPPKPRVQDTGFLLIRGECRLLTGDLAAAVSDLDCLVLGLDARPAHPDRLRGLELLVLAHFLRGAWTQADAAVRDLIEAGGETAGQALRGMLSAARGSGTPPGPKERFPAAWPPTRSHYDPHGVVLVAVAATTALSAHRRYADILDMVVRMTADSAGLEDAPGKFAPLWLPAYAEASVETAPGAAADDRLAHLRECADQTPYLRVLQHRVAGRLAERRSRPSAAEREYEAGLGAAESCAQVPPLHRAQLEHAYGRFLCARGRSAAGAIWLESAQSGYAAVGALADLRACARDRAAAHRDPAPDPGAALTEREATVAGLVALGLINRQVAEELLISAKAVEYHLRKVFRKLGVHTRSELARLWQDRGPG